MQLGTRSEFESLVQMGTGTLLGSCRTPQTQERCARKDMSCLLHISLFDALPAKSSTVIRARPHWIGMLKTDVHV